MSQKFTVDIDIGGTLTDGLFSDGSQVWVVKVDTTPHDFTVCFFDCLREGAEQIGYDDLAQFLEKVAVIRWSSTIATNVLAERKGPRIGLLMSPGNVENLYGETKSPAIGHLVNEKNIATIENPENQEEILMSMRSLLEQGVRRICVSFDGAFNDKSGEDLVKQLAEEHFPDHYLGAVPVVLGSDICMHPDNQTRTHMALINSYVHTPLATSLFKAEDDLLSQYRYRRPVYIGHVNGGVARIAKTKGFDTTESGPVFGLEAGAYFAREYKLDRVISLDVGGTTAKIGLIVNGEPVTARETEFFGIPLKIPSILLRSAALGGGSIASVQDGHIKLGPESMGAFPGPACYDLGGDKATLTDAFLVASMINPAQFLGGKRQLSVEQAEHALEDQVASPLNISVEEAANRVIQTAVQIVTDTIHRTLEEAGYHDCSGFQLFCFGGNGGNFAGATADHLGIENAYVFELGPVLSAFGSSVSDICHIHEEWPFASLANRAELMKVVELTEAGRERVLRDLEGEGIASRDIDLNVELTIANGDQTETLKIAADRTVVQETLERLSKESDGVVERIMVKGVSPVPHFKPPSIAIKKHRANPYSKRKQAELYNWKSLSPGASVTGPAVLESETNSCTVPAGWELNVDGYGNGVLERVQKGV